MGERGGGWRNAALNPEACYFFSFWRVGRGGVEGEGGRKSNMCLTDFQKPEIHPHDKSVIPVDQTSQSSQTTNLADHWIIVDADLTSLLNSAVTAHLCKEHYVFSPSSQSCNQSA